MSIFENDRLNRRQFLGTSAAATAALAAGGRMIQAAPAGPTVVIARDKTKKSIDGFNVNADIVKRLVDQAVMKLSGKDDIVKAWRSYVDPNDRVAIKFNGLFNHATTHPEVIKAVTDGLVKAGVKPDRITVYDRHNKDVGTTGMKVNREGTDVRAYGTEKDYGPSVKAGPVGTKFSKILTEADVLINLPILKSHVRSGVTGALKNHLGSIPNAGAFHQDNCVRIADLNKLGPIKDKTRICIADAIYGLYNGGPSFRPQFRWDYHGIIASTDPVALDTIFDDIVTAQRLVKGMSPRQTSTVHISRAAELGLGEADIKKINRVKLEI